MIDGRWLELGRQPAPPALGRPRRRASAKQYGYLPGETRTIRLNNANFGVVGVLGPVPLDPDTRQRRLRHPVGGEARSSAPTASPTSSISAPAPGRPRTPPTPSRLPSTWAAPTRCRPRCRATSSQAQAQANKTLQKVALFAGLLALTVGGLGIANVMSISVIQRSAEIGIRRAVGHSRTEDRRQFLLESLFVGILGGARRGRARGRRRLSGLRHRRTGWSSSSTAEIPIWMGLALLVSVGAGLYPSIKAARLEPLETLRLG